MDWNCRIALVIENLELLSEISRVIATSGSPASTSPRVVELAPSASTFEISKYVDTERPDVLFVEFARTSKPAAEWISDVRRGGDSPLVVAVHPALEPAQMISALRAGASEFLCHPIQPAMQEAMERIASLLESKRAAACERGRVLGFVSAKGGCGATSILCHLAAALQIQSGARVLVADMDHQLPAARQIFRAAGDRHSGHAFESVRRLNSGSWREFVGAITPSLDLLAGPTPEESVVDSEEGAGLALPEPWRVESLYRFASRQYRWILADLGRHLNPANWTVMQNIDELCIVTAPDVLALYQARSILQTLSSRGFDRTRTRIILNRNGTSPRDFWVESIEQMFEMPVYGVLPNDPGTFEKLPADRFQFPADSHFGRAVTKFAQRILKGAEQPVRGKAA